MMELLRTDTTFRFLGMSRNGWVSIAAFMFGVGWIVYAQRRAEKRKLYGKPTFLAPGEQTEEDHGPRTTDHGAEEEPEDDDVSVPLSRGTGEPASQGDEGSAGEPSKTDEEHSDDSGV
jgi:hypothetical protein